MSLNSGNTNTYTTAEPCVEAAAFEHVMLFRPSEYLEMRELVLVFEVVHQDDDAFWEVTWMNLHQKFEVHVHECPLWQYRPYLPPSRQFAIVRIDWEIER